MHNLQRYPKVICRLIIPSWIVANPTLSKRPTLIFCANADDAHVFTGNARLLLCVETLQRYNQTLQGNLQSFIILYMLSNCTNQSSGVRDVATALCKGLTNFKLRVIQFFLSADRNTFYQLNIRTRPNKIK